MSKSLPSFFIYLFITRNHSNKKCAAEPSV